MNEQLSALIDDEIAMDDASHLLAAIQSNKQFAEAWSHYHMIGDAMRGIPSFSSDFKQNLMQKIELEATVLSPNALTGNGSQAGKSVETAVTSKNRLPRSWAIAASVAAVMVVGWVTVQQQPMIDAGMKMAELQNTAPQNVSTTKVASLKESIPTEYLMAHEAFAPSLSSYYIQTVNYAE